MTFTKGITQASLFGLLTGSLLATTTIFWFDTENNFYLPLMVAFWWLVIFGCNLWHAYQLSNQKLSNTKRFSMQITHAGMAALVYYGIDVFASTKDVSNAVAQNTPALLEAGLISNVSNVFANTGMIVMAAFILSLVTSGLLYSILSHPSAK